MEQHQSQWYLSVGRFAVAMGEIETAVSQMLKWLPVAVPTRRDSFFVLLERLEEAVKVPEGSFQAGIASCLEEAGRLRGKRNSILHSAVTWQVAFEGIAEDAEIVVGPDFRVEDLVPYFASTVFDRKDPSVRLNLQELEGLVSSAEALSKKMWRVISTEHTRRFESSGEACQP